MNNDTMSDDEVVASYVYPQYSLTTKRSELKTRIFSKDIASL